MEDSKDGKFFIEGLGGAQELQGNIAVRGAKNAALKACAASILFSGPVTIQHAPFIEDIFKIIKILEALGAEVAQHESSFTIHFKKDIASQFPKELSNKLRASVVLAGPVLARAGEVHFPHPGGCLIGARPIDIFLEGFQALGAEVEETRDGYSVVAKGGIRGGEFFFKTVSVTGTETLMMAAVLAKGKTILKNAALEPEIEWLARFLNANGARIVGAGTSTIEIQGVAALAASGACVIPPDRIETGSLLILGALTSSYLKITNCEPMHVESVMHALKRAGADIEVGKDFIEVRAAAHYKAIDIKTHEYPGFPTDLQAPMVVFLTQAEGESLIFETIFEGRFKYVEDLVRMGANIRVLDQHRILVTGPTTLLGKELQSPDLRAGLAYIIAALVAEGRSVIHNVYTIDRGYERIEERLRNIGANITRSS